MFRTKLWMTVALAVAVAAPSWAQGRGQGRGQGFGGMMGGPMQILMIPAVQEELKLTEEQKGKLQQVGQEIRETMGQALQGLRDLSPEERQKKMQDYQAESTKKINAVLKEDQQKRLRQLVLQRQGVAIVAQDEEVAKQLKVTDDQKLKIRDITRAAGEERRALFQGGGGGGGGGFSPEMRAKMDEITKKTNEKIEAVLTDKQKKQWKELCGAPFKFPEARRAA
jgi:Spy/CpxP family protein refolding chaperone